MKKITFALLAFLAMGTAKAEGVNAGASTAISMQLDNIITLECTQSSMSAHFTSANSYGWHQQITGTGSPWGQNTYKVQSNRYYNVTISLDDITYTGTSGYASNNTSFAAGDVRFKLEGADNHTGGTPAVSTTAWTPFSGFNTAMAVLNNCPNTPHAGVSTASGANTGKTFGLSFLATPDWQYAGGTYTTSVTVTATQE